MAPCKPGCSCKGKRHRFVIIVLGVLGQTCVGMQAAPPIPDDPLHVPLPDVLELIQAPGRAKRPKRIAIILRGPPGSGKSHVARKLRDAEVAAGGEAPRIHSIDDYFITVSACVPLACSIK